MTDAALATATKDKMRLLDDLTALRASRLRLARALDRVPAHARDHTWECALTEASDSGPCSCGLDAARVEARRIVKEGVDER